MPFKKMTIREQIEAKRELKQLRALREDLRNPYRGTRIAEGSICSQATGAIQAAEKLGYVVVVRTHPSTSGNFIAAAYKLGNL